jgi:hypothetical protein
MESANIFLESGAEDPKRLAGGEAARQVRRGHRGDECDDVMWWHL